MTPPARWPWTALVSSARCGTRQRVVPVIIHAAMSRRLKRPYSMRRHQKRSEREQLLSCVEHDTGEVSVASRCFSRFSGSVRLLMHNLGIRGQPSDARSDRNRRSCIKSATLAIQEFRRRKHGCVDKRLRLRVLSDSMNYSSNRSMTPS